MLETDLCYLDATSMRHMLDAKEVSCRELVEAHLRRIDALNPSLNAYVTVLHEEALQQADAADAALASCEDRGPLHGIPIALKDQDLKRGVRYTAGSRLLKDYVAPIDAIHVERLDAAGAIVLGKTNAPEFGHKGVTDNLLFGPTSTPFAPAYNAGGSSGGSAAAVAAGLAPMATGGDGGGSIRIPAAMCGIYGLKPSFGRIPVRTRPDAFQWHAPYVSLGPLTRSVRDSALMFDAMAGPDPRDPLSAEPLSTRLSDAPETDLRGLRIAYSPDLDVFPVERDVADIVARSVQALADAGATVERVTLGLTSTRLQLEDAWLGLSAVRIAEMAAHMAKDGIDLVARRDDVSPEFMALIERGQGTGAVEYKQLDVVRTEVYDAIERVMASHDVLVSPTLSVARVKNDINGGTLGPRIVCDEEVDPLIGWCLTYPLNFTGHPAASVPVGMTDAGAPVGMQLVGPRFRDDTVVTVSAVIETLLPWSGTYETIDAKLAAFAHATAEVRSIGESEER